jgi:cytochrome c-type biogenesis protein
MQAQTPLAPLRPTLPRLTARLGLSVLLVLVAGALAIGWLVLSKSEGPEALAEVSSLRRSQIAELTASLTRSGLAGDGVEVDVILTTPDFFRLTRRTSDAESFRADQVVVFVANETVHSGDLPHHFAGFLRIDGSFHVPSEVRVLTDAEHHRTSVLIFDDLPVALLDDASRIEMLLPAASTGARATLVWDTPIDYPASIEQPHALTLGLLLSLTAGLMAAISPCLLQLTAFYLPTLAGVSAAAAAEGLTPARQRRTVLGTAGLFVLGFTVPYTIGGALMGGIGQTLADNGFLDEEGPIVVGAGLVMILMAGVVAYRAKAPLVCRVPLPGAVRRRRRLALLTPFISGFAMATGCLACFGGAVLGVLLVYAGLLGSPLLGGLAMFVFSMGIAIPFLLAAWSMSWVMPISQRAHRLVPAIGFLSAAIMLFFGVVMASGHFHVVSGWLSRNLPLA